MSRRLYGEIETELRRAREERIWHCPSCGRFAFSSNELLGQGCEGRHLQYLARSELDLLRRALDELIEAVEAGERTQIAEAIVTAERIRDSIYQEAVNSDGELIES
jgi:hypothetical protein